METEDTNTGSSDSEITAEVNSLSDKMSKDLYHVEGLKENASSQIHPESTNECSSDSGKNTKENQAIDVPELSKNLFLDDMAENNSDDLVLKWDEDEGSNTTDANTTLESTDNIDQAMDEDPADLLPAVGNDEKLKENITSENSETSASKTEIILPAASQLQPIIGVLEDMSSKIVESVIITTEKIKDQADKDETGDNQQETEVDMSLDDVIASLNKEISEADNDMALVNQETSKKDQIEPTIDSFTEDAEPNLDTQVKQLDIDKPSESDVKESSIIVLQETIDTKIADDVKPVDSEAITEQETAINKPVSTKETVEKIVMPEKTAKTEETSKETDLKVPHDTEMHLAESPVKDLNEMLGLKSKLSDLQSIGEETNDPDQKIQNNEESMDVSTEDMNIFKEAKDPMVTNEDSSVLFSSSELNIKEEKVKEVATVETSNIVLNVDQKSTFSDKLENVEAISKIINVNPDSMEKNPKEWTITDTVESSTVDKVTTAANLSSSEHPEKTTTVHSAIPENVPSTTEKLATTTDNIALIENLVIPEVLTETSDNLPSVKEDLDSTIDKLAIPENGKPLSGSVPLTDLEEEVPSTSKTVPTSSKDKDSISENSHSFSLDGLPTTSGNIPSALENVASTSKSLPSSSENLPPSSENLPSEQMAPDASDEIPEVTDSLGLLAETFRTMDDQDLDDDEPDPDDEDDGEDEEDFDQDDESNLTPMEHSEDSNNAQSSETDQPKEPVIEAAVGLIEEIKVTEAIGEAIESPKDVADDNLKIPSIALEVSEIASCQSETDIQTEMEANTNKAKEKSPDTQILKSLLETERQSLAEESPAKSKKLEISQSTVFMNFVDLEESSSEDDVQEVSKTTGLEKKTELPEDTVAVNLPRDIEVMSNSVTNTSEIISKEGEVAITGIPKPVAAKVARLNTDEVSIKTASTAEPLVIPEAKIDCDSVADAVTELNQEVFNLDSDDENKKEEKSPKTKEPKVKGKCANPLCGNDHDATPKMQADPAVLRYYEVKKKRRATVVCVLCANDVAHRMEELQKGVMSLEPLLELKLDKSVPELVEISDSETDSDGEAAGPARLVGREAAALIEAELENMLNNTWNKYNLEDRLHTANEKLNVDMASLEKEAKEIDAMLEECQVATDAVRREFYGAFARRSSALPAFVIVDTPTLKYAFSKEVDDTVATAPTPYASSKELGESLPSVPPLATRSSKRNIAPTGDPPAKRPAIPLGFPSKQDNNQSAASTDLKDDDVSEVAVVRLSVEAPPRGLPPPGELPRPAPRGGDLVLAARHAAAHWTRARVELMLPRAAGAQFSQCRVRFELKTKAPVKMLSSRHVAYAEPASVRLTIGTRIIALFKDPTNPEKREVFYSGVVAEVPNPVNYYRYLVFFDDGYAQYVKHENVRVVVESSTLVWDEVHPLSREFVRNYLLTYPERPMVRLHAGQRVKTEWNGKWWASTVLEVDASLVNVHFEADNRTEWIYRGSTRLSPLYLELQAAERHRSRAVPRSTGNVLGGTRGINLPYVEYTRSEDMTKEDIERQRREQEEIKRQRAVAKKSTSLPQPPPGEPAVMSRVVYYTPKAAVKPHKMSPHNCSPRCRRTDVLPLKELRTYNPLARPLLSGWERQTVRFRFRREIMYRAPCGRRLRDMEELHNYLMITQSEMSVDLFDFGLMTHCLAEFVLNRCIVSKKDLSHGKENVPVPCVNYYDTSLPEFCSYNTERTPTAGVPLNLDPEFLCGCDCVDDCRDKSKCACWKMTMEGARTIGMDDDVGYIYKRLQDPVPSGIYECNSRCKCKQTCLNRVAQHPLQLKLQVFKTQNRGWGIRALNDVPKGAFLCVYAGNLLTDATANLDGLNEGDEYLAELDYIEVVEQMKEGFEADIPERDKEQDRRGSNEDSSSSSSSEEEEPASREDEEDGDFRPDVEPGVALFSKRLRRREKKKEKEEQKKKEKREDDCITISDDEELREPSNFSAQAGMGANKFISKYRSVRAHFGADEACYIMDAKVQGNLGRYLNHSCTPNVFVQNVFVDTHDPRFPWVAFFALAHVKAGTELTWNYNYDIGSVPGKVLYCYCGAPNCRGRLL